MDLKTHHAVELRLPTSDNLLELGQFWRRFLAYALSDLLPDDVA